MKQVTIVNRSISIDVAKGTILEAALEAGLPYPHGCRTGTCGTCKSRLLGGDVDMLDHAPEALSPEERQEGLILACRATPLGSVDVEWLDDGQADLPPLQRLNAKVTECALIGDALYRVRMEPLDDHLTFLAGQYADLRFGDRPARSFSMANRPDEPILEFYVRHLQNGQASDYVATSLEPGETVRLKGPYGAAYLRPSDKPIIAIAGGSGLAPLRSIVRTALHQGHQHDIRLYFGVRDEPSSLLLDEYRQLSEDYRQLLFLPVLSAPNQATDRRVGLVHDAVAADFADLSGHMIYSAGPSAMIDAVIPMATARGADPASILVDRFEPAKENLRQSVLKRFLGIITGRKHTAPA
ncbi:MAG: 2Fe-2S iron-sulfur cluster-binding protein [Geminicoccaceae bacterium]